MINQLAPFILSPFYVIRQMLQLANVSPEDILYDLGCGDGRILLTAVKEFEVKKEVGYEIQIDLYYDTLEKTTRAGLEKRLRLVKEDLMNTDLAEASVMTQYLTQFGNMTLKRKLLREVRDGTPDCQSRLYFELGIYEKR
jgi:16S rRNA A1518/A1519 N6-dimethyltransferase RsmA/KsgA/DIM1 with predicted DNA glycosylase/AP lyase activity